jgi:hypothetical protein
LRALGYEYDDALRDRNIIYGFHRYLGNDVRAIILFQRHQYEADAVGYKFTVELVRCKTANIGQWHQGIYEDSIGARLGHVLWFVYSLRIYAEYDQWWTPTDAQECTAAFTDVLDKLERYGIPWLEDPQSRNIGEPPARDWDRFREALQRIASPELEMLGFEAKEDSRRKSHPYFVKKIQGNLHVFVVFSQRQRPDSPQLAFDVLLFRKETTDPFGEYRGNWLQATLGELLWNTYGLRIYPSEFAEWEYGSREELEEQLKAVLDTVKKYAIPWLEDLGSRNPKFS